MAVITSDCGSIREHVTVRAGLSNTSITLGTLVAVKQAIVTAKLGDVVQTPIGCLFSKVFAANLT